ncbi:MAG: replication-associated recombination protein A [Nitrospirae bacterium]|nr:MAG: replication-associated recombination protein A [Nitrospirota bacterium]
MDLFAAPEEESRARGPLAERMRPRTLDDVAGQDEILAPGRPLRVAIEQDTLTSLILWGPPGSGKTSLARLIASHTKAQFEPFSAATSGLPELRRIIKLAEQRRAVGGRRTILFVDEIHRFNKAQQDAFLPHVESGTVTLVGATTENPSFEVVSPLLSRSLVVVLQPLSEPALAQIIGRALKDQDRGLGRYRVELEAGAMRNLAAFANGDARVALNALEFAVLHQPPRPDGVVRLDAPALADALQKKSLRYDKGGEEHYNLISAFIKSLRDSDPDGALYWMARMLEGGEEPRFIARRMVILASEDIGNADPMAIVVATAVAQAVELIGLPECKLNLAQGVTYLATCPKDNASYRGLLEAGKDAKEQGNLPVPLHLRNAPTDLMKDLGYGKDYRYMHDDPAAKTEQTHLPDKLKGKKYYKPKKSKED